MKRTNGTDHTISKKDTLEQKFASLYVASSKKSEDRFKCIHSTFEENDEYEADNDLNDDDEFCDD